MAESTLDSPPADSSVYRHGTKVQRRKETYPMSHWKTLESTHLIGFLAMERLCFKNPRPLSLYKGILESRMIIWQGCGVA